MFKILSQLLVITLTVILQGCVTELLPGGSDPFAPMDEIQLPYLRNSANECYYLDEFMPVPDSLVAGKHGRMNLRYYTYRSASYKDWSEKHIVLAFYSQDDQCWSLFEESYVSTQ